MLVMVKSQAGFLQKVMVPWLVTLMFLGTLT
jgi:hypothetical protein